MNDTVLCIFSQGLLCFFQYSHPSRFNSVTSSVRQYYVPTPCGNQHMNFLILSLLSAPCYCEQSCFCFSYTHCKHFFGSYPDQRPNVHCFYYQWSLQSRGTKLLSLLRACFTIFPTLWLRGFFMLANLMQGGYLISLFT